MSQLSAGCAVLVLFFAVSSNLPETAPPPPEEVVPQRVPEVPVGTAGLVDVAVRLGEGRVRVRQCLEHCACRAALDEMATVNDLRRELDRTIAELKEPENLAKVDVKLKGLEAELRFWDAMSLVDVHTPPTAPESVELLESAQVLIAESQALIAKTKPDTIEGVLEWLENRNRCARLTEALEAMKKKMVERENHRCQPMEDGVLPPVPIAREDEFYT